MEKFKVGDTVRCVGNGAAFKPHAYGYKPDKEFVVKYYLTDDGDGEYIYFSEGGNGVYECDLILVKFIELPKSFACTNTNQVLWDKYIKWLDDGFAGDLSKYYGITRHGSSYNDNNMTMFDTILSLEEWDEMVNGTKTKEINMKKYTITRDQLKSIHDVACDAWKSKIQTYTLRNPFGNTFEFTQEEVGTMFKAATLDQTPVLEGIFGKQTREIDLSTGLVDGNVLFDNNRSLDNALMCVRLSGEYENKAFVLNNEYNWEIVDDGGDNPCLVPTRK